MRIAAVGFLLTGLLLIQACTTTKIEHPYQENSVSIARTDMPAERTNFAAISDRYTVPAPKPFESDDYIYRVPIPTPIANDQIETVRMRRLGDAMWLRAKVSPSQLWPRLKQFISEKSWAIAEQRGEKGSLIAVIDGQVAHFKILQGFQDNSSELYLRISDVIQSSLAERSSNIALEQQVLEQAEAFLSAIPLTAYSYIAQGISTEQRMLVEKDAKGYMQLRLKADSARALASLKSAIEAAHFAIKPETQSEQKVTARYLPPPSEDDQPNWLMRLFFVKTKIFDPDVEYGGNTYQFSVLPVPASASEQFVRVERNNGEWKSERSKRDEMNAIMRLIKGSIN